MQPLYTEQEFESAKSRRPLPLRCIHCLKTFFRTKHNIQDYLRPLTKDKGDFCSQTCNSHYRIVPPVLCKQCNHLCQKSPKEIKKSEHHFCSRSCAAKYNNAHKTKGTRVSKLEVWLSKKLPELYPALEFHFNRKDAINGELDIYIPSLKLAFELNGIFHYEPIYGKDKLASIQTNDTRKTQACLEHNIELCIIDVSSLSYFKEQKAVMFLQIIQKIINVRLSRSSPASSAVSS
jgi:hypothetical protein